MMIVVYRKIDSSACEEPDLLDPGVIPSNLSSWGNQREKLSLTVDFSESTVSVRGHVLYVHSP